MDTTNLAAKNTAVAAAILGILHEPTFNGIVLIFEPRELEA